MTTRPLLALAGLPANHWLRMRTQAWLAGGAMPMPGGPPGSQPARSFVSHELMAALAQTRFNQQADIDGIFSIQKTADCVATSRTMQQALGPMPSDIVRPVTIRHPGVGDIEDRCRSGPLRLTVYGALSPDQGGTASGYAFHHALVVLDVIRVGPGQRPVAIVLDPNDRQRNPVMDALFEEITEEALTERIDQAPDGQPLWSLLSKEETERIDARLQKASATGPLSRGQLPYRILDLKSLVEGSDARFEALQWMNHQSPLAIRLATPQLTTSVDSTSAFSGEEKAGLARLLDEHPEWIEHFEVRPDDRIPLAGGKGTRPLSDGLALSRQKALREEILGENPARGMFD